jgi:hypothetical protein
MSPSIAVRSVVATILLGGAALSAGACGQPDDGDDVELSGAAQSRSDSSASTLSPPPGTDNNELDVDLVVTAWKKVKEQLYDTQVGYSYMANPSNPPKEQEAQNCMDWNGNSVPYYSDILWHFYCWHPSYEAVSPNVRGCFSNLARGQGANYESVGRVDPVTGQSRSLYYPEIYDYCLYQEYDAVLNKSNSPTFDENVIALNKSLGNKVGVLKWVDDNEREAFQHVMYTWYNPDAFSMESQQRAINEFYGVTLSKVDYTAADANDVAACRASKRKPIANVDPTDGTHCSSVKVFQSPRQKHPGAAAITAYMQTL